MRESAQAALSYVRAHAAELAPELPEDWFAEHDIHLHVPAGAIPKDGPSAGITMATALVSLLTGAPVRDDVAMTGEITLTGQVLPIGGLKEKALAAQRSGIADVIAPKLNEPDVDEIPEHLRADLDFMFVDADRRGARRGARAGRARRAGAAERRAASGRAAWRRRSARRHAGPPLSGGSAGRLGGRRPPRLVAIEEQPDPHGRSVADLPQVGDRSVDVDAAAQPAGAQPCQDDHPALAGFLDLLDVVRHLRPHLIEALEVDAQVGAPPNDALAGERREVPLDVGGEERHRGREVAVVECAEALVEAADEVGVHARKYSAAQAPVRALRSAQCAGCRLPVPSRSPCWA